MWPTPEERDKLFYIENNGDLPKNKKFEYGDPHPDRDKYPYHKLVYVSPQTPDNWSKWYYASARILEDEYNWTFTDADLGDTRFKAVNREYVTLRDKFSPDEPAMGFAMPDIPRDKFEGEYVLASREQLRTPDKELDSIFVFERLTYVLKVTLSENGYDNQLEGNLQNRVTLYYRGETVPGPDVPIEDLMADETSTYWGLQADKTSRTGRQLTDNWFSVTENRETLRRQPDGSIGVGWPSKQEKSIGNPNLTPAKFQRQIIKKTTVEKRDLDPLNVDDIPEPDALMGDEVERKNEKVSDYHYNEIVSCETIDENADPLLGEQTGVWGVEGTSERLVEEGTPTPFGYGIKSSEVVPLGNGKSVERVVTYPPDEEDDGIIYTLSGLQYDEIAKASFQVDKSLVDAARAFDLAAAAQQPNNAVELQPLDKWHSIMFVSSIRDEPQFEEWCETGKISLPNVLDEIGVIWDSSARSEDNAGGVDNIGNIIADERAWTVSAQVAASVSVFAAPYIKIVSGFRGTAVVRVRREFSQTAFPCDFEVYNFKPVHGTLTIQGGQASGGNNSYKRGVGNLDFQFGGGSNIYEDGKMAVRDFGPVEWPEGLMLQELGDDKSVIASAIASGGSTPGGGIYPTAEIELSLDGSAQLDLPESSVPLQSGDEYILHVDVRPWRFGWWVRETYTAIVP